MNRLRSIHLAIGIIGLIAFALSGQYMHFFLGHLRGMPDGSRLLYRTSHIYLLWASLLNLLLGSHFAAMGRGPWRLVQMTASLLILMAPILIGYSFFVESTSQSLYRPFARFGIYMALAGSIAHAFVSTINRWRNGKSNTVAWPEASSAQHD